MKTKTLAALALIAALGASPAWAAEVVSSNIVGYQKVELQPGFNFVAPQFTAVGGGAIDLQSIKLDVADEDATGGDNIQILDEGGGTVAQYYWLPPEASGAETAGWFDENFDPAEVSVENGLSVLLESSDELSVTVSGEVSPEDFTVASVAGFNFVGNASPVAIDIQDIKLGIADEEASGGDNIQILDDGGATIAQYYWLPPEASGAEAAGWFDENFDAAEVELAPGQGFLIEASENDISIRMPSAL